MTVGGRLRYRADRARVTFGCAPTSIRVVDRLSDPASDRSHAPDDGPVPDDAEASMVIVRRSDPRLRLQRTLPGERLHEIPEMADRLCGRGEWQDRKDPVPPREYTVRTGQVRASLRRVEAGPNAPKLIRLIQHPYALDTDRCRADASRRRPERFQVHEVVRVPFGLALRDALADGVRAPFPRPTKLHPQLVRPRRLPLADWLRGREEP